MREKPGKFWERSACDPSLFKCLHGLNVNNKGPSETKCLEGSVEMTLLYFVALRCLALRKLQ